MSEWIQESKKLLEKIMLENEKKNKDRLDLVNSSLFMLSALQRSMLGWIDWFNKANVMAMFSKEELEKINEKLSEFARSFIEYDLEITKLGESLGVKSSIEEKTKPKGYVF
jgi:hypothetical protein